MYTLATRSIRYVLLSSLPESGKLRADFALPTAFTFIQLPSMHIHACELSRPKSCL